MARDSERQSIRDYASRKRRNRKIRIYIFTTLLLVMVVSAAVYIFRLYHRTYSSYEVSGSTPNTEENLSGYLEYNGSVVRYGLDGAVAYDKKGKLLWNGSYEMQDPVADTCGKYVVIADRGNKSVYVYNEDGEAAGFTMEYNIIKAEVASQGVIAVLMGDEEANYVRLYDLDGAMPVEKKTYISKEGYPMDMALSDDGKKLAMIFMLVNKGKLVNNVGFWNFGEVGQNWVDNFVGGYLYNQEENVMPRITFLDNDTVCAYKDNGFILYSIPELSEEIKEENVEGKIKSILHGTKYTGLVLEGENRTSRLLLYDLKGKKLLDKKLELDYSTIFLSGDEIIMYDNLTCQILKTDGTEKFRYTFTTNISALYPVNHLDRYLLVSAGEITEIRLLE